MHARRSVLLLAALSLGAAVSQEPAVLPAKTSVELELLENLNSQHNRAGDVIRFRVAEEVRLGDRVIFEKGAPVQGRVKMVEKARTNGRAGALTVIVPRLRTAGGHEVPMFGELVATGRNRSGASGVAQLMIGVAGFGIHGREIAHLKGERFLVHTRQQEALDSPAAPQEAPAVAQPAGPDAAATDPGSAVEAATTPTITAASVTIEYFPAKGTLPETLEVPIARGGNVPPLEGARVSLVRIGAIDLTEPIPALEIRARRKEWQVGFDAWKVVRHLDGSREGVRNDALLRVALPDGRVLHAGATLTLVVETE